MAPAWHPGEAHDLWIILWKDIANVSDQIVSGRAKDVGTAPLLTRGTEKPLEILEDEHSRPDPTSRRHLRSQKLGPAATGAEPGKARCRFHGGKSTDPKTQAGRAQIAEVQRLRWLAYRERFGRSEVATKPDLKDNYLLPEHASLHRNARRVARASLTGGTGNRLVTTVRMRDRIGWPPGSSDSRSSTKFW